MKIIKMEGTRPDGIKIQFTEDDVEKIRFEEFTSVEVVERMTAEECLEKYGVNPKQL